MVKLFSRWLNYKNQIKREQLQQDTVIAIFELCRSPGESLVFNIATRQYEIVTGAFLKKESL